MAKNPNRITTGQLDWSGGINSSVSPTIAGPGIPNGLKANQLAWAQNATVRKGGISTRSGMSRRVQMPFNALFAEASLYKPNGQFPYLIALIGGHVILCRVDTDYSIRDLSVEFNLYMPANEPLAYMVQGEEFLIIQAGDYTTLPLFWDGVTLRRSLGPSRVLGVVNANFAVPAVGVAVLVTLTGPFTGTVGDTILIDGATYTTGNGVNFIDLYRNAIGTVYNTGDTVPAGTTVTAPGQPVMKTLAPFTVPLPGNTAQDVPVDNVPPGLAGAINVDVNGDINSWQIPATGLPPAGANQVYLVNLTATPAANVTAGSNLQTAAELPAAGPMDYYMGRIWLAAGRQYVAGDIVGGPNGTAPYDYRDSILKFQENEFINGGGVFIVPDNAGDITALKHPIKLDTATGEGQLHIHTRERVYSCNVVPTRAQWQALEEPIQRVAQMNYGTASDRSVVPVNGDLFFQTVNGIYSMTEALRYFDTWGNVPISIEETRAIELNDRALLKFGSGIEFSNRLLQTCLPYQTEVGVCHRGLTPLNFDVISTLAEKLPPSWEGLWEGVAFMRLLKGDYGGLQRAFAMVRSDAGDLEVWEISIADLDDINKTGEVRIDWVFETPSFTWGSPFQMKRLETVEIWIDRLFGTVDFTMHFRPDNFSCWQYWIRWQKCSPRDICELPGAPPCSPYPQQPFSPAYALPMVLPLPPSTCNTIVGRPINIGYQFQFRLTVKGVCRIRGLLAHAHEVDTAPGYELVC